MTVAFKSSHIIQNEHNIEDRKTKLCNTGLSACHLCQEALMCVGVTKIADKSIYLCSTTLSSHRQWTSPSILYLLQYSIHFSTVLTSILYLLLYCANFKASRLAWQARLFCELSKTMWHNPNVYQAIVLDTNACQVLLPFQWGSERWARNPEDNGVLKMKAGQTSIMLPITNVVYHVHV